MDPLTVVDSPAYWATVLDRLARGTLHPWLVDLLLRYARAGVPLPPDVLRALAAASDGAVPGGARPKVRP